MTFLKGETAASGVSRGPKGDAGEVSTSAMNAAIAAAIADVQYPRKIGGYANSVNFNSVADTQITIDSPTTNYRIVEILIANKGTTASLTAARFGLFSASGAGGTAIKASGTAMSGLTSNAVNTGTSLVSYDPTVSAWWNLASVYFRITTAQGAAASGDVYVIIEPLP